MNFNEYKQTQGRRFRVTDEQSRRIKAGTLTREQALMESVAGAKPTVNDITIPKELLQAPDLTVDNFSERVLAATGSPRRFRMSREQRQRNLTREEAFKEWVSKQ